MRDRMLRDAVSIGLATGIYAVSFGVLSVAAGFSVAQTCVMSLATFTGASQLTFVSVLGAGGSAAAALPPALLLAGRNAIYALSLKSVLRGGAAAAGARRAARDRRVDGDGARPARAGRKRRAFLLTAVAIFVCWNLGHAARRARRRRDRRPARLRARRDLPGHLPRAARRRSCAPRGAVGAAVAGAAIALVLLPLAPAGVPVMAAALVRAVPAAAGGRRDELVERARAVRRRLRVQGRGRAARRPLRRRPASTRAPLELVVVPVLAALVVVQTLDGGRELVIDARAPALLVGAFLIWRRAPLLAVALAAGATAALLRLAGG